MTCINEIRLKHQCKHGDLCISVALKYFSVLSRIRSLQIFVGGKGGAGFSFSKFSEGFSEAVIICNPMGALGD